MEPILGCLVPPAPWIGLAVGSFDKAVSILHPDGALVSVVARPEHLEARAMLAPSGWKAFAVAVKNRLDDSPEQMPTTVWDGATLCLVASAEAPDEAVELDFRGYSHWDPRIGTRPRAASDPARASAVMAIIRTGVDAARVAGRRVDGIHGDGIFATAWKRLAAAPGFPASLVGFGPGTTPAGDDWLAGFLSASDALSGEPGRAQTALRAAVSSKLERTTPAGRALLLGAIAGAPPAYLVALARATEGYLDAHSVALAEEASATISIAVTAALGHGASSGEDALAGFIAGLEGAATRAL